MPTRETLAARLKALRKRAGFDRAGLAVASGISIDTINRIEQGHSKRPRETTIRALAAALNTTPDALLAGTAPEYTLPPHGGDTTTNQDRPPTNVAESIRHAFRDNAEKIEQFFLRAPRMTDHDRAFILSTVEWLSARLEAGRAFDETRAIRTGHATNDDRILTK